MERQDAIMHLAVNGDRSGDTSWYCTTFLRDAFLVFIVCGSTTSPVTPPVSRHWLHKVTRFPSTTQHKNDTMNSICVLHITHSRKDNISSQNMDSAKILLAGHLRADKCCSYESYPDASLALHRCPHMSFTKSDQTPEGQTKTSNQHHDLSFYVHKVWWQRRPSADSTTSAKSQSSARSK